MANEARLQIIIDAVNNAGDELEALQGGLKGTETESQKAAASLKDFGGSADDMVEKLLRTEASSKVLQEAKDKIAAMTEEEKAAALAAADLAEAEDKTADAAKGAAEGQRGFSMALTEIQSGVSLAKEALGGLKEVWDFAKEGAENQRIAGSFQQTAKSVGVDADRMLAALDAAAHGTVDDEQLMQAATRDMGLGVTTSTTEMVQLMELARAGANRFGGDAGQAFESISESIGNLQTRALKQFGIIVDVTEANKKYATSHGLVADAMTEEEQRAALLADVLEKGATVMKDFGDQGDTVSEKMKRAEVAVGNLLDVVKEIAATGIGTALDIGEAPAKLGEAFSETAKRMQEDVAAGRMTVEDYNNALRGMSEALSGPLGINQGMSDAAYNTFRLNDEQARGLQTQYAATLNETARAAEQTAEAERQAAQDAANAQAALNSRNETTREYVHQLGEQMRAAQEAAAAEAVHRGSIAETIASVGSLAESLGKATDAQAKQMLAQGQLDVIKKAYEEGRISETAFVTATDQVLLRYDLATPKSLAMAEAQQAITDAFLSGEVPLNKFVEAADKIPGIAADGELSMKDLAELGIKPTTAAAIDQTVKVADLNTAWGRIPREVKTVYTIETKGEKPAGGTTGGQTLPGREYGGPSGEGGMYMLHPNEWVLSEAQRYGRAPIPAEALPGGAPTRVISGGTTINNIYLQDTLATKMFLEQQRLEDLRSVEEMF